MYGFNCLFTFRKIYLSDEFLAKILHAQSHAWMDFKRLTFSLLCLLNLRFFEGLARKVCMLLLVLTVLFCLKFLNVRIVRQLFVSKVFNNLVDQLSKTAVFAQIKCLLWRICAKTHFRSSKD
jgi:hypothetical protein